MSLDSLRELVGRLTTSTYALSALGLALEAKLRDRAPPPELHVPLAEVLAALDVTKSLDEVTAASARPLLGEIQTALRHGVARLAGAEATPGWRHTDAATLTAAGDVSAGFPAALQRFVARLGALEGRLAGQSAAFLDVGVGVGALSIEMARAWPRLRVVGIDLWAPSLALARENVRRAELQHRIELREQGVQDLPDEGAFDLAWLPSAFIPGDVIPEALRRIRQSLRPGGWVLFATATAAGDPLTLALARLRTKEWGATPCSAAEAEALLGQAGFAEISTLPRPPASTAAFIAGRVPE
jgi:precorrin-6B methylase 2